MILITKNAMNSGAGCCKSDITDQYSAPSEVMTQTIQKNMLLFFSILTSLTQKPHQQHNANSSHRGKRCKHCNNDVNILSFHKVLLFVSLDDAIFSIP